MSFPSNKRGVELPQGELNVQVVVSLMVDV
jgi:hypothetical protein